jgi:hypothetical protein
MQPLSRSRYGLLRQKSEVREQRPVTETLQSDIGPRHFGEAWTEF